MKTVFHILILEILASGIFIVSEANAECECRCINGQNVPLCSSALDIPPICPPTICPIAPPSIAPIQSPQVPPIGTQNCWQQQVLNPYTNHYEWQRVCR